MLSKRGSPAGHVAPLLHLRQRAVLVLAQLRLLPAWIPPSHSRTGSSGATRTRTGRVLMKRPTISSTPGSSGGRPETVAPKTTSSSPRVARQQQRPRALHQVLSVSAPRRAASCSVRVSSAVSADLRLPVLPRRRCPRAPPAPAGAASRRRSPPARRARRSRRAPGPAAAARRCSRGTARAGASARPPPPAYALYSGQHVAVHQRQAPPVQHQVVVRPYELVRAFAGAEERQAHEGRLRQVEAARPVLAQVARAARSACSAPCSVAPVLPQEGERCLRAGPPAAASRPCPTRRRRAEPSAGPPRPATRGRRRPRPTSPSRANPVWPTYVPAPSSDSVWKSIPSCRGVSGQMSSMAVRLFIRLFEGS